MSVAIINVRLESPKTYSASEMQCGLLYKIVTGQGEISKFDTVYTKTVGGEIVWFEQDRVGLNPASLRITDKFVLAPKGTIVTLT